MFTAEAQRSQRKPKDRFVFLCVLRVSAVKKEFPN